MEKIVNTLEDGTVTDEITLRHPPARAQTTSTSTMSDILRQSFIGGSMLPLPREQRRFVLRQQGHLHRGPKRQSLYIPAACGGGNHIWPYTENGRSRRLTLDSSDLSSAELTEGGTEQGNLWTNINLTYGSERVAAYLPKEIAKTTEPTTRKHENKHELPPAGKQIAKTHDKTETPELGNIRATNIDRGYAWVILIIVFLINCSTLGATKVYALIYNKLAHDDNMSHKQAILPFTTMTAIENIASPLSSLLLSLTGSWRIMAVVGSLMITVAHFLAAFLGDTLLGQLLPMGILCGIGLSFVSISFFKANSSYFDRYQSLAFGIGRSGSTVGALVLNPICQSYLTIEYESTKACYLVLSAILAPNIAMGLLLKPLKPELESPQEQIDEVAKSQQAPNAVRTISETSVATTTSSISSSDNSNQSWTTAAANGASQQVEGTTGKINQEGSQDLDTVGADASVWAWFLLVIKNPYFHLIWPTQLLYLCLNFCIATILVDFATDRGLCSSDVARMVPCWAWGGLAGRVLLSNLIDLKLMSISTFTGVCLFAISLVTMALKSRVISLDVCRHYHLIIMALVFVVSMSIALLSVLVNGLSVSYVKPSLRSLSFGISSFSCGFFLFFLAELVGYYRDTQGNYDGMLALFSYASLGAGLIWLIVPAACERLYSNCRPCFDSYEEKPKKPAEECDSCPEIVLRCDNNKTME